MSLDDLPISQQVEYWERVKDDAQRSITDLFIAFMVTVFPYTDRSYVLETWRMAGTVCGSSPLGRCIYPTDTPCDERICIFCEDPCGRFDP